MERGLQDLCWRAGGGGHQDRAGRRFRQVWTNQEHLASQGPAQLCIHRDGGQYKVQIFIELKQQRAEVTFISWQPAAIIHSNFSLSQYNLPSVIIFPPSPQHWHYWAVLNQLSSHITLKQLLLCSLLTAGSPGRGGRSEVSAPHRDLRHAGHRQDGQGEGGGAGRSQGQVRPRRAEKYLELALKNICV